MTFGVPLALLALLAIPALAALYWLAQQRRRAYTIRFTNLDLLGQVAPRGPGIRRHLPTAVFLLALAGLIFSFSRPQAIINIPRDRSSVMLVIDTSGSMQATDVLPNRLTAAESAARSLVNSLPPNASVGLVGFASSAYVAAPLTQDHETVISALHSLRPNGGTAIGDGVELALDQLNAAQTGSSAQRPPTMIVLLTDGVSNAGVPTEEAAARAAAAHVPVETVGVGQRGGQVFVRGQDVGGVDEEQLQAIAQATSAQYFYASEAGQLQRIYSSLGGQFGWKQEHVDLTVPVAIAGTIVLVLAAGLSLRWFRLIP